jgi:Flp pilus assembly protein TadD
MLHWIKKALTLRSALPIHPASRKGQIEGWMNEALGRIGAGDTRGAEEVYWRVLGEDPDHSQALYQLGEIEALRQNNEHAAGLIQRAISIKEDEPKYHYALGCVLQSSGQPTAAIDRYRRTLALAPSHVAARINLGCLLQHQSELEFTTSGRDEGSATLGLEEAMLHFRAAAELAPQHPDAWINLGYAMARRRDFSSAVDCYDRALAIDPRLANARFNRSVALLAQGRYREGWEDYEWRWPATGYERPVFPGAVEWDGSPPGGKTILLYTEQGFGDAIQFVRFAAQVAALGARLIVRCQPELRRLLQSTPGISAVFTPGEPAPEFDLYCALLSLPRLLRITSDQVPAPIPYIAADEAVAAKWRTMASEESKGVKVGLVWASQSPNPDVALKSASFQAFAPLISAQKTRFYSLQLGEAARQALGLAITDVTAEIRDFADTAGLIDSLDLTISVDTAVAHLAGAMGKPVWTLLPHVPDWRWEPDSKVSKWYPTMRLYRQARRGDWASVVSQVIKDLQEFTLRQAVATSPT